MAADQNVDDEEDEDYEAGAEFDDDYDGRDAPRKASKASVKHKPKQPANNERTPQHIIDDAVAYAHEFSISKSAKKFNKSKATIHRWVHCSGQVQDRGRPRLLSETDEEYVINKIAELMSTGMHVTRKTVEDIVCTLGNHSSLISRPSRPSKCLCGDTVRSGRSAVYLPTGIAASARATLTSLWAWPMPEVHVAFLDGCVDVVLCIIVLFFVHLGRVVCCDLTDTHNVNLENSEQQA